MSASAEEFRQLQLKITDPIQYDYEVIRPVILYAETISERSRQTEIERRQVGETARRFIEEGMYGLGDRRVEHSGRKAHEYPKVVARHILYLKQLYPPIHYREIARIVERKYGYKTNHVTVKKFLDRHPIPVQLALEFRTFHEFKDAYQARWTVVQMWYEGWNKKSIAGCLQLSRRHVGRIIDDFQQDGFVGLEDERTRPANHPHNQMTLPFMKDVLDVQKAYPRAGRFRVHGLLAAQSEDPIPSERTVARAMAINREFHGAPPAWQSDKTKKDTTPKYLLYRPQYRHEFWFIDLRYLVQLDGKWCYSICIIEGYSRTILAGAASEYQDLTAVLQVLFAALQEYGCPEAIISDNGSVFAAKRYKAILRALQIEPKLIEKGKPWQNLIEAQFKVQLRLADFNFEQAQTFSQVQDHHADFIRTFNHTSHYGHQDRADNRRTPAQVLAWVRGNLVEPAKLQRLFQQLQFTRTVNRFGFVSIQRFFLYAEQGLSRHRVSIWILEGTLHVEYQHLILAQYQCDYHAQRNQLLEVSQPTLFQTPFVSPQLTLFELDDQQWLKIRQRAPFQRQNHPQFAHLQPPLFDWSLAV